MPASSRALAPTILCGLVGALALSSAALLLALVPAGASGLTGSVDRPPAAHRTWQPLLPGHPYRGDFPDPSVLRVGGRYYAQATNTHGLAVPTLISTDLRTWWARPATAADPTGDGLVRTASWSDGVARPGGRFTAEVWAPTVTRLGPGRYVLAYATRVRSSRRHRMCVSVATARMPEGPFTDRTRRPLVCPPHGAIDPQVFKPARGRPWLIWKVDRHPARLFTRAMNRRGTRLLRHSRAHLLAKVAQRWEGGVIENPGMIRFGGRYYLFYSGNRYQTRHYAIGYLICRTLFGRCFRPRSRPLLASRGTIAGPGGAAPFVDRAGRLRLAYHAWRRGRVGYSDSARCRRPGATCGQRRLYIATVRPDRTGRLLVVHRR